MYQCISIEKNLPSLCNGSDSNFHVGGWEHWSFVAYFCLCDKASVWEMPPTISRLPFLWRKHLINGNQKKKDKKSRGLNTPQTVQVCNSKNKQFCYPFRSQTVIHEQFRDIWLKAMKIFVSMTVATETPEGKIFFLLCGSHRVSGSSFNHRYSQRKSSFFMWERCNHFWKSVKTCQKEEKRQRRLRNYRWYKQVRVK